MTVPWAVQSVILGLVSAVVALLQTWSVQRFGAIYGGVIGSLPIIILPTSIVLAVDEDQDYFEETLFCVPIGVLITTVLILAWRNIPLTVLTRIPHATLRMLVMVFGSILAWTVVAIAMRFVIDGLGKVGVAVHYPALGAFAIQVFVAMFLIVFGGAYSAKGEGKVRWKLYVVAGILGLATGSSLIHLAELDPIAGGLLMSFPVNVIASLASLVATFAESLPITATTAMIAGSVSTSLYSLVFAELLPVFDAIFKKENGANTPHKTEAIVVTTLICWIGCLTMISLPVLFILRCLSRREKRSIEKVNWSEAMPTTMGEDSEATPILSAHAWRTLGLDVDDFDSDGMDSSVSEGTPSNTEGSLLHHGANSIKRATLGMGMDSATARRAALVESVSDESPLFLSHVPIPESPVVPSTPSNPGFLSPNGSSRKLSKYN